MENITEIPEQTMDFMKIMTLFNKKEFFLIGTLFGIVGCLSILGNSLTIAAFCVNKSLRSKYTSAILSLTISDIIGGLVAVVTSIHWFFPLFHIWTELDTYFISSIILFPTYSFQCHMVLIASERYFAVVHPLCYLRIYTQKASRLAVCGTWFFSILLTFSIPAFALIDLNGEDVKTLFVIRSKLNNIKLHLLDIVLHFSVCIFVSVLYFCICLKVRKIRRDYGNAQDDRANIPGYRVLKIVCIIVFYFMVSWTPLITCKFAATLTNNLNAHKSNAFFLLLGFTNFGNNFIIFTLKNKKFRKTISHMFQGKKKGRSSVSGNGMNRVQGIQLLG